MREQKGKNLLIFPNDYTVIDIETTGLSPEFDDIIEISALKYRNKELSEKFSTLINPTYEIDEYISQLTGITNDMLISAPIINDVLPQLFDFIGDDIIVGHNVNFDINFLYDNAIEYLSKPLCNNFVDTMRIARLLHKENKHNRLSDLSKQYNLSYDNAHRAEFDCLLTNNILSIFEQEFKEKYGDTSNLNILLSHSHNLKASDISTNNTEFDVSNPIYGKTVVFTGTLDKMVRKDAMQIVADLGGINGNGITKKTNYLILGNNDYCATIKNGKSSKQKKAEDYKLQGYDIEIIPENVFYDMINEPLNPTSSIEIKNLYPNLSDKENQLIGIVKDILSCSPYIEKFNVEQRSDNYITLLCGQNDFMRFKYSPRTFWLSLRLPTVVAKENISNPLFAVQKNKKQLHWKCSITSINEIENIRDFIVLSFVPNE